MTLHTEQLSVSKRLRSIQTYYRHKEHQTTLRYCNAETPTLTAMYRPFVPCLASWAEQPTVTKDSLHWIWNGGRGWKYFLKQRVHCLVQGILCNFWPWIWILGMRIVGYSQIQNSPSKLLLKIKKNYIYLTATN